MNKKKFVKYTKDNIGRKYVFDDGSSYYGVTTLLDVTKSIQTRKTLNQWERRVGIRKAQQIKERATNIGKQVHSALEDYINKVPHEYPNTYIKNLAGQLFPFIDKHFVDVITTEKTLYSDSLNIAGTVDAIATVRRDGIPFTTIIDFKTAKKPGKIEWYNSYFLQLALYSLLLKDMTNISHDRGMLLFVYKENRSPNKLIDVDLRKYYDQAKRKMEQFQEIILKNNS